MGSFKLVNKQKAVYVLLNVYWAKNDLLLYFWPFLIFVDWFRYIQNQVTI